MWTGRRPARRRRPRSTGTRWPGSPGPAPRPAPGCSTSPPTTSSLDRITPYPEDAPTAPVNAYGRGKLIGERAVLATLPTTGYVVRTAWLYGAHGRNFVDTMLRLAAAQETVEVVVDQRGQPTWTVALAEQLAALAAAAVRGDAPPGVYHGTATGEATWHDLAQAVFAALGLDPQRVHPTTSDRFPRPARRPAYSVLGHDRWRAAGLPLQPHWRDQLATYLATRTGSATSVPSRADG